MHKGKTLSIGHRGASALRPENTLESFKAAFDEHQCDMIEFDVHLSKDLIPIVFHDETLERTTDGKGFVAHQSLQELKSLDAGFNFDPESNGTFPFRGKGIKIPTLEEVFELFPEKKLAIEIKSVCAQTVDRILKIISKHNAFSRVVVGSLYDPIYQELKQKQNNFKIFSSKREAIRLYLQYRLGINKKLPCPDLVASLPVESKFIDLKKEAWIKWLQNKGITVYYWTVNDPQLMKILSARGADGLMSDNPGIIQAAIAT